MIEKTAKATYRTEKMIVNTGKNDGQHAAYLRRVDACAIIAMVDKAEKIAAIAARAGVCVGMAARIYVNGSLKRAVLGGQAKNRLQALDQFEASQIGDKSRPLMSVSPVSTAVARLNAMTGKAYTVKYTNGMSEVIEDAPTPAKKTHQSNHGKVYGELYTTLKATEMSLDPAVQYERGIMAQLQTEVDIHCSRFIAEYVARLSNIGRKWINAIKSRDYDDDYICTREGHENPETAKLNNGINNMVARFPLRNISTREYIELIRKYA